MLSRSIRSASQVYRSRDQLIEVLAAAERRLSAPVEVPELVPVAKDFDLLPADLMTRFAATMREYRDRPITFDTGAMGGTKEMNFRPRALPRLDHLDCIEALRYLK